MGLTFVNATVASPARPGKGVKLSFLLDSGAVYSLVPGATVSRLRIKAEPHANLYACRWKRGHAAHG